jgi:hypothetical protein
MELIRSLAALAGAALFGLLCAEWGLRVLKFLRLESETALENLLCCTALGVIGYETLLAILEFALRPRLAVILALATLLLGGIWRLRDLALLIVSLLRRVLAGSLSERLLAAATIVLLLFESLASAAPLTGSDALHYHFAAPLATLRNGFAPDFSLVPSFLLGQGHLLILTGLALGSEKLSLALIFLGGVLAAAAAACLARRWVSREYAWLCGLTFLLTPVVFWQTSTAGAPDIWMALFATLGILVVAQARSDHRIALAFVAGGFAGALAGAKYTGCIFAAALLAALIMEARSFRGIVSFCGAALIVGIWSYARNLLWTHDPVFPFALRWLAPEGINTFTLASVIAGVGASGHRTFAQVSLFPVFASTGASGFWQFFGPLPFACLPLMFRAARNTPLWRGVGTFSIMSSLLVGFSSGMLRYLLPAFPTALAAAFASIAVLRDRQWRLARAIAHASITALCALCAAGVAYYATPAAQAGIGWKSREGYLKQKAPDYGKAEFVNQQLEPHASEGKTLVFFQHRYYLRVPFVCGNPDDSWDIDPRRYGSAEAWLALFREQNVRWVVRAPNYPPSIAAALIQLEHDGRLVPMTSTTVTDFSGMRVEGIRTTTPITILRVVE